MSKTIDCPNCGHKLSINSIFASVGGSALLAQRGKKYFSDMVKKRHAKNKEKNGIRNGGKS